MGEPIASRKPTRHHAQPDSLLCGLEGFIAPVRPQRSEITEILALQFHNGAGDGSRKAADRLPNHGNWVPDVLKLSDWETGELSAVYRVLAVRSHRSDSRKRHPQRYQRPGHPRIRLREAEIDAQIEAIMADFQVPSPEVEHWAMPRPKN